MVARVHHHAAHLGPAAHVAAAAGLADLLVLVVEVADLADGRHARGADATDFAGGQPDGGHLAFLGEQLCTAAGAAHDLAAASCHQLHVVDLGAERDPGQRQGIADARLHVGTRRDLVTDRQAVGQQHVALLAVGVVQETDARGAVRIVFDGGDRGGHPELVAPPVEDAIQALVPRALVADRQLSLAVSSGLAHQALGERSVWLAAGDLVERGARHLPQSGTGWSVVAEWHVLHTASKSSIFWPGAIVTIAFRQPGTVPRVLRPRRFCLGWTASTRTRRTSTLNSASTAALIWNL